MLNILEFETSNYTITINIKRMLNQNCPNHNVRSVIIASKTLAKMILASVIEDVSINKDNFYFIRTCEETC